MRSPLLFGAALPPPVVRYWKAAPLPGVTHINAKRELAASDSRSMTPALVHSLVFVTLETWTVTSPSPVRVRYTKRNSSAVLQISAPDARTVNEVPLTLFEPAAATAPMSAPVQSGEV